MRQGRNDRLLSRDYREPYKLHSLERLVGWLPARNDEKNDPRYQTLRMEDCLGGMLYIYIFFVYTHIYIYT